MATAQAKSTTRTSNKNIQINNGRLYVTATFNNTLVTITDEKGNAVASGSTGAVGFKGSRKSTPFAATTAIDNVLQKAKQMGLKQLKVYIKGPGVGRDAVLRVLRGSGVRVVQIADVTPMPHNGCRPKKRRRA